LRKNFSDAQSPTATQDHARKQQAHIKETTREEAEGFKGFLNRLGILA